jgi:DNA-binding MarR family transcriptional regulator
MDSRRRRSVVGDFHVEATAFLHEIIRAADCLRDARTFDGPRWRLLRAIERCGGAPTFSDLGRLLDMSRQGAREQALGAAEAGVVELFPAHDDRRALQVMLTPAGRRALEAQRMPNSVWLFTLLNGLDPAAMRSTEHVLRIIRLRLERYDKARRRAQR